jgi:hypothetical protein
LVLARFYLCRHHHCETAWLLWQRSLQIPYSKIKITHQKHNVLKELKHQLSSLLSWREREWGSKSQLQFAVLRDGE